MVNKLTRDEKTLLSAVGRRLRELRELKGYSQEELANRSNLATFTVSRIESQQDQAQVRLTTISRICRSLGLSVGEFFAHLDNADVNRERRKKITHIARQLEKEDAATIDIVQGVIDATLGLHRRRRR